jgi:hypothetical protein
LFGVKEVMERRFRIREHTTGLFRSQQASSAGFGGNTSRRTQHHHHNSSVVYIDFDSARMFIALFPNAAMIHV